VGGLLALLASCSLALQTALMEQEAQTNKHPLMSWGVVDHLVWDGSTSGRRYRITPQP